MSPPGKRLSTSEPLTEHDVAERLDKAALRVWRIMLDVRQTEGLMDAVKHSRYFTNVMSELAGEMTLWGIKPYIDGKPANEEERHDPAPGT